MLGLGSYRGAVRPPFIEAAPHMMGATLLRFYRGAVRPPFIEAGRLCLPASRRLSIGGQSAPPSLKQRILLGCDFVLGLSGGSPPPLH